MRRLMNLLIIIAVMVTAMPASAELALTNTPMSTPGKYLPFAFSASGTGNSLAVPHAAALLASQRIPYAVEWMDGGTPPAYPLTVVMTSGGWTLTWTLTDTDTYQYYFDAAGDSGSPPTIAGAVTVTVTADGESSGGLGSGDGTLRIIFW